MIDLHTHTFRSDGALVPAELIRRAVCLGYRCIGITDHADDTNFEEVIEAAAQAARTAERYWDIKVLPGVELTHIPPPAIAEMVRAARKAGAKLVIVHGETIVEPVAGGTNSRAIAAGADILAHPGLITPAEARRAAKKGVHLEITTRRGHSLANGHVARVALAAGAPLVVGTDSHHPDDLTGREKAEHIVRGAGLSAPEVRKLFNDTERLALKLHGSM